MSRESLADISVRYGQFSTFGHKDYEMAKKAGYSDNDIKRYLDEDESRLHADNRKGGKSGLYDEILGNTVDLRKKVDIDRGPRYRPESSPPPTPAEPARNNLGLGSVFDGAYNPSDINVDFGGIDMGNDMSDVWSNEDFIRGLAKERAEAFTDGRTTNQNQSIVNNIEQNIGNKGDWETNIGDNNTINNSSIGNDYSLALGNINVANKQNQFAV